MEHIIKAFDEGIIKGVSLANRFVRSATWEGLATDKSFCSPELTQLLVRLAKGGVELIISSHSTVSPEGQAGFRQVGMRANKFIPNLADMPAEVHKAGSKIFMQINHAGSHTETSLMKELPMGPIFIENEDGTICRAMTDRISAEL